MLYLNTKLIADETSAQLGPSDLRDYCNYVKRVTAIHKEAVQRLVDCDDTKLLELAELFEGAANLYLDISEDIRARFTSLEGRVDTRRVPRALAPRSAITNQEEVPEG